MLSDKINGLPISRVDSPAISRLDSTPISRIDPPIGRLEPPQNRVAPPQINRFDDHNAVNLVNKQGNILSFDNSRRNSNALENSKRIAVDRDRPETSTTQQGKSIAYGLNETPPEVEKRRAELAAQARAAEARAREAEEKCEQAEGRLERELRERLNAEQRLKELEENRLRQQSILIEAPQTRTATWAQGGTGTGARMKESDTRSKEADVEIQTLMIALMEAEQKRAKAESIAQAEAAKARELESQADAFMSALADANRKLADADAAERVAEEKSRSFEALVVEAEAAGRQANERYHHVEAELQYEAKQRAVAEQKLKEFEDELSSYLELDWSKGGPDLSRDNGGADEVVSQFHAQVDAERKARREAQEARAALELRMREMEKALRIAEENNRQIAALNLTTSADEDQTTIVKKRKGFKYELKFIGYSVGIALVVVTLIALVATYFLK